MRIAVDGPAGSGKSTVAKELSRRLNIPYLETGLAYRAAGFLALKAFGNLDRLKWDQLRTLLNKIEIRPLVGRTEVRIEGRVLEEELRSEEVGRAASIVGTIPEFREFVNSFFRKVIGNGQAVVEGRDAGTNIIPEADLKIFITASPEERAKRRYVQLKAMGVEADYGEILSRIEERDRRDREREKYPFRAAPDALIIDTTGKSVEEVMEEVMRIVEKVERK